MAATDADALIHRIRHAHRRATDWEWCLEEDCEFRHWTSGSVPTHRRGPTCPPMPTLEAAVLPIVADELRAAKAEALREAARYFAGGLHCADMRTTPEETVRYLNRRATEYETGDQT